jgi:hypothetical protein
VSRKGLLIGLHLNFSRLNPFVVNAYLEILTLMSLSHKTVDSERRAESLWTGLVSHPVLIDSYQRFQRRKEVCRSDNANQSSKELTLGRDTALRALSSRRKGEKKMNDQFGSGIIPKDREILWTLLSDLSILSRVS